MAKLSAFGRVEVSTFLKTESTPTLKVSTTKLRLMSDGVVLSKFDGVFYDGAKLTGTWKKAGRIANEEAFATYCTTRGFTKA